jgi:RimJ/RimL family protein N-acetyltransferase
MGWEVRRATTADAEEIARVNVASWRAAYRGLVPDAVLDRMDPAGRTAHLGTGAGHAVHQAGVAHLAASGFRHAVLWVFADNPSSHAFYRAHGWQPDGATRQQPVGDAVLPVLRFARALRP